MKHQRDEPVAACPQVRGSAIALVPDLGVICSDLGSVGDHRARGCAALGLEPVPMLRDVMGGSLSARVSARFMPL